METALTKQRVWSAILFLVTHGEVEDYGLACHFIKGHDADEK